MAVYQQLSVTCVGRNAANNTSQVQILWTSAQTGQSYNSTVRTGYYYVSCNEEAEQTYAVEYTLPYQETGVIAQALITVPHDSDGNARVRVRTWMNTHISAGVVELNQTLVLDQLPRASAISASDGVVGQISKIVIDRKSSEFTHSIAFTFGTQTGYLASQGIVRQSEVRFENQVVNFVIPQSFYQELTSAQQGECRLTCRTYRGEELVGTPQETTFLVRVDSLACQPDFCANVEDSKAQTILLTGNSKRLIRFCSNALCTLEATAKNGAQIEEMTVNGHPVEGNTYTVAGIESDQLSLYTRDSRGFTNQLVLSVDLIPYVQLTALPTVSRTSPTGTQAKLQVTGACYHGTFGREDNTLTVTCSVDGGEPQMLTCTRQGNSYQAQGWITGVSYERSYVISVEVSDCLQKVKKTVLLGKGMPVFDWGESDFAFHVPVHMDTPLALSAGGTGAKTAQGVLENLGITATASEVNFLQGVFAPVQMQMDEKAEIGHTHNTLQGQIAAVIGWQEAEQLLSQRYEQMEDGCVQTLWLAVSGVVYLMQISRWTANNGLLRGACCENRANDFYCRWAQQQWQTRRYPNPPMVLGQEYCTTQNWREKPVYTALISFGHLPNATLGSVEHGLEITQVLSARGQTSDGRCFPIASSSRMAGISLRAGCTLVEIETEASYSAVEAYVQLWYTKD